MLLPPSCMLRLRGSDYVKAGHPFDVAMCGGPMAHMCESENRRNGPTRRNLAWKPESRVPEVERDTT